MPAPPHSAPPRSPFRLQPTPAPSSPDAIASPRPTPAQTSPAAPGLLSDSKSLRANSSPNLLQPRSPSLAQGAALFSLSREGRIFSSQLPLCPQRLCVILFLFL